MKRVHTLTLVLMAAIAMVLTGVTSTSTTDSSALRAEKDTHVTAVYDGSIDEVEMTTNLSSVAASDTDQLTTNLSSVEDTLNFSGITTASTVTEVDNPTTADPCAANSSGDEDYNDTTATIQNMELSAADQISNIDPGVLLKAPNSADHYLSDGINSAATNATNMERAHSPLIVAGATTNEAAEMCFG